MSTSTDGSGVHTNSTSSSRPPPANTDRRANSRCCSRSSRSKLHPIVALSVRWRSGASWLAAPGRSRRCASRSAMAAGASSPTREAASSIPRGRPSSCRQIATTASSPAPSTEYPGRTRPARARKSCTDGLPRTASAVWSGGGTERGGTGYSCSIVRCSGARLVAMTVRPRARCNSSLTSVAAGSSCSRLSRTRSVGRSATTSPIPSVGVRPTLGMTPRRSAMVPATRVGSVTAASGTQWTPPG